MEDNFYLIEGLAAYLRVNDRKLRQMMQDERPIPEGFTTELDQLTRITTQIINKLITSTEENQHRHIPVWRTDAEFHTADIPYPSLQVQVHDGGDTSPTRPHKPPERN